MKNIIPGVTLVVDFKNKREILGLMSAVYFLFNFPLGSIKYFRIEWSCIILALHHVFPPRLLCKSARFTQKLWVSTNEEDFFLFCFVFFLF